MPVPCGCLDMPVPSRHLPLFLARAAYNGSKLHPNLEYASEIENVAATPGGYLENREVEGAYRSQTRQRRRVVNLALATCYKQGKTFEVS
jgi:hypothetical protein